MESFCNAVCVEACCWCGMDTARRVAEMIRFLMASQKDCPAHPGAPRYMDTGECIVCHPRTPDPSL